MLNYSDVSMISFRFKFICVFFSFALLEGCAGSVLKPIAPEVEVNAVELSELNFPVSNIVVAIAVTNPNDFDIHINNLDMELHIFDRLISKEHWTDVPVLHANEIQNMRILVKVNFLDALPIMPQLMSGADVPYRISGTVQLKGYGSKLPFTYDGDFKTLQKKEIVNSKMEKSGNKSNWF